MPLHLLRDGAGDKGDAFSQDSQWEDLQHQRYPGTCYKGKLSGPTPVGRGGTVLPGFDSSPRNADAA